MRKFISRSMAASIVLSVVVVPRLIVPTAVLRLAVVMLIVSPSLAPIWNVIDVEEASSEMPLNCDVVPIWLISDRRDW